MDVAWSDIAQGLALLLTGLGVGGAGAAVAKRGRVPPEPMAGAAAPGYGPQMQDLSAAIRELAKAAQHGQARTDAVLDHMVSTLSAVQAAAQRSDVDHGKVLAELTRQVDGIAATQRDVVSHLVELRSRPNGLAAIGRG